MRPEDVRQPLQEHRMVVRDDEQQPLAPFAHDSDANDNGACATTKRELLRDMTRYTYFS
jgi:hypothetical protein